MQIVARLTRTAYINNISANSTTSILFYAIMRKKKNYYNSTTQISML